MSPSLTRVACIGECMIELSELGDSRLSRTHGDDTPGIDVVDPTAAYLAARLDGAEPAAAARAGHELAGTVIRLSRRDLPASGHAGGSQSREGTWNLSRSRITEKLSRLGGALATSSWSKSCDRDIR